MTMPMTPDRWAYTSDYLRRTFGHEAGSLEGLRERALAAGLPDIAVSGDVGSLLSLLASTTKRRMAIEVGTLGGYSAIWIARGFAPGRLLTIEYDERHADFAEEELRRAGLAERVELRRGAGLDVLDALARELAPGSVDFAFIDADKREYPAYWERLRPLIAPGGLFVADNILGTSAWWIDDEAHPARMAVDALSCSLAADPEFDAAAVPIREGLLIARRRES
jgi:predicted O-methyltransferase YrrM